MKNKKVTIEELKKALKKEDSIFSIYFYRKISLRITQLLVKTSITPNQITFLSLIVGLASAYFFISGDYYYALAGVLFLHLSFLLDHVDGEIARYKNLKSPFGAWFDQVTDRIRESLVFAAIAVGVYNNINNYLAFIFGMLAIFNLFMVGYVRSTTPLLGVEQKAQLKIGSKMHIGSVDTTIFLVTIGAIVDSLYYVLVFYACFVWLAWVYQIYTRYKRSSQ